MKRTKKLLALALALMMALGCMAMPAMAHGDEDEGIMPLYEAVICPDCGGTARVTRSWVYNTYSAAVGCPNSIFAHVHHFESIYIVRTNCMECRYDDETHIPYGETCPFDA